MKINIKSSY